MEQLKISYFCRRRNGPPSRHVSGDTPENRVHISVGICVAAAIDGAVSVGKVKVKYQFGPFAFCLSRPIYRKQQSPVVVIKLPLQIQLTIETVRASHFVGANLPFSVCLASAMFTKPGSLSNGIN